MKRLTELRKERHVSQAELAELLHISQQAICKYELGQSEPDIYTLKGLAQYFHTSIDYLVGYDSGNSSSDSGLLLIENTPLTSSEIEHIIEYRRLTSEQKEHINFLVKELTKNEADSDI